MLTVQVRTVPQVPPEEKYVSTAREVVAEDEADHLWNAEDDGETKEYLYMREEYGLIHLEGLLDVNDSKHKL